MGQEQVHGGVAVVALAAELADARAGVEDQLGAVRERDLDARGVATVDPLVGAGRGDRPARAPVAHAHQGGSPESVRQNTMIAPLKPSAEPSGSALTSTSISSSSLPEMRKRSWAGRPCRSATVTGRLSVGISW